MILINLFFQPVYRVDLKAKLHYITLSAYTLGHGTFITKVERYIKKEVMLLILFYIWKVKQQIIPNNVKSQHKHMHSKYIVSLSIM